jgi:hypothetical protein
MASRHGLRPERLAAASAGAIPPSYFRTQSYYSQPLDRVVAIDGLPLATLILPERLDVGHQEVSGAPGLVAVSAGNLQPHDTASSLTG